MNLKTHNLEPTSYSVSTSVFEGPLDLLLQLIERAEVDITNLALAQVTDQFLLYLDGVQEKHPEEVSAFILVASRLMQIKSEALLPRPPEREPGEEDPAELLIQQLVVYKRYKEIANILAEREKLGLQTYLRLSKPPIKPEGKLDLGEINLEDLFNAASDALSKVDDREPLDLLVKTLTVTIRQKIGDIEEALQDGGKTTFQSLLANKSSRNEVVVTFLALLELVKQYRVIASQNNHFGEIELEASDSWDTDEELEIEFLD